MIEDDVLQRIKYLLEFNHWTLYKLAKQANLPYSSLNNLFTRNTCPSIPTLQRICNGFNISLTEFFEFSNNPLRNNEITEEEQQLLNSYKNLSHSDKELLGAYLQGLQKK